MQRKGCVRIHFSKNCVIVPGRELAAKVALYLLKKQRAGMEGQRCI